MAQHTVTLRLTVSTSSRRKFDLDTIAEALKEEVENLTFVVEDDEDPDKYADYDVARIEDLTPYPV